MSGKKVPALGCEILFIWSIYLLLIVGQGGDSELDLFATLLTAYITT